MNLYLEALFFLFYGIVALAFLTIAIEGVIKTYFDQRAVLLSRYYELKKNGL